MTEGVLKTELSLICDIKIKKATVMELQQQKQVGKINPNDSHCVVKSDGWWRSLQLKGFQALDTSFRTGCRIRRNTCKPKFDARFHRQFFVPMNDLSNVVDCLLKICPRYDLEYVWFGVKPCSVNQCKCSYCRPFINRNRLCCVFCVSL